MSLALALPKQASFSTPLDRALGDTARALRRLPPYSPDWGTTVTLGLRAQILAEALEQAVLEAQQDSWDGFRARSVQPTAVLHALAFLRQLPSTTPVPDIGVDTDGEIAIEWDFGPRRTVSIRVASDGTLTYAGLLGRSVFHGVEPSRESIPSPVATAIWRVILE